jgi:phage shock protein PspC (stress-responsive transcriptional regulator)
MEPKRLYRSRSSRWIAGVCGGIAEYLNIDPIIVRIIAIFLPGFGWLAYLILALIIPNEP